MTLYAVIDGDPVIYAVIGWDTSGSAWRPVLVPVGEWYRFFAGSNLHWRPIPADAAVRPLTAADTRLIFAVEMKSLIELIGTWAEAKS